VALRDHSSSFLAASALLNLLSSPICFNLSPPLFSFSFSSFYSFSATLSKSCDLPRILLLATLLLLGFATSGSLQHLQALTRKSLSSFFQFHHWNAKRGEGRSCPILAELLTQSVIE
jgi:hypothetical protein